MSADASAPTGTRRLAATPRQFESRDAIEAYLAALNQHSPEARRGILGWGSQNAASLRVSAVGVTAAEDAAPQVFLGEAETSFDFEVRTEQAASPLAPYVVGLLLSGRMEVTLSDGHHVVEAGQGIVIDTACIQRSLLTADSHFVEFSLPRHNLLRLGAELRPGEPGAAPRFEPLLRPDLAQRLLVMATLAGNALGSDRDPHRAQVLFRRWTELIAMTLLDEQTRVAAGPLQLARAVPPARLRRALDFIDAHAHLDIDLAAIADAAHVSASSLLRQFRAHFDQTPAAFLRQVRLDRAHAELRRGDAGSIREIAARWGFQNASKFSQAYQRRFGELPRESRTHG